MPGKFLLAWKAIAFPHMPAPMLGKRSLSPIRLHRCLESDRFPPYACADDWKAITLDTQNSIYLISASLHRIGIRSWCWHTSLSAIALTGKAIALNTQVNIYLLSPSLQRIAMTPEIVGHLNSPIKLNITRTTS
jgi:hypothetical protein